MTKEEKTKETDGLSKGMADYLLYRFKQYLGSVSREIQNRRLKEQKHD